jgi:hypothetical protein
LQLRPPSLLSGTIGSAATRQVSTYAPGIHRGGRFLSARRIERELDERDQLMQSLIFGKLPGVNRLVK